MEISPEAQQKLAGKLSGSDKAGSSAGSSASTGLSSRDARNTEMDTATRVAVIIEESTGVDVEEIEIDSHITDDLHIDSVSRIDIAIRIEDAFHVRIEEEDIDAARTVKDIVRFIDARTSPKE
ncbi:MAG TPA: acyl carrier protein [Candidatus Corynebacterium avicola]|uniref:Acyl carrier protein n=1 Tax=Candidatus Corynebacterium avicola TaxID=2838527 RepID=A0A9D1UL54_9CORY|nr:acyl carrier protein [Candidatus Corynebacterium avicola]